MVVICLHLSRSFDSTASSVSSLCDDQISLLSVTVETLKERQSFSKLVSPWTLFITWIFRFIFSFLLPAGKELEVSLNWLWLGLMINVIIWGHSKVITQTLTQNMLWGPTPLSFSNVGIFFGESFYFLLAVPPNHRGRVACVAEPQIDIIAKMTMKGRMAGILPTALPDRLFRSFGAGDRNGYCNQLATHMSPCPGCHESVPHTTMFHVSPTRSENSEGVWGLEDRRVTRTLEWNSILLFKKGDSSLAFSSRSHTPWLHVWWVICTLVVDLFVAGWWWSPMGILFHFQPSWMGIRAVCVCIWI